MHATTSAMSTSAPARIAPPHRRHDARRIVATITPRHARSRASGAMASTTYGWNQFLARDARSRGAVPRGVRARAGQLRDGDESHRRASTTRARAASGAMAPADADGPSRAELWWRAIKLPMYSVAWIPILCAASLVYLKFGVVDVSSVSELALGSSGVVAWLNLSNDAWDASTTVDATKPESVVNLMGGNAKVVHAMAWAALLAGAGLLYAACAASGNPLSWKLLLGATALGHAYQGPPFRLSYKGLGEPIAFTAFGPLATVAFYIALCGKAQGGAPVVVTAVVSSVAVLLGCTTAFILFTSHFHQEAGDRAAGKLSPIVRLGLPQSLLLADNLVGAHYACIATLAAAGWLPYTAVFGLVVSYPLARHIVDYAQQKLDANDIDALFFTKYLAVRWHIVHGVALALGIIAQRVFLSPDLFV